MKLRILSAITKFASIKPVRLHMPGHKANRKFCKLFKGADLDVTELSSIDNENELLLAERDVAEIFDADKSWFLTGGSSQGVLGMVYAVRDKGKKLVIEKSSHKSVYNALEICQIEPIIIDDFCGDDEKFIKSIETSLGDDVIGALLTYPDYYGNVFNLKEVAEVLREKRKLLLLDSAHGGHIKFIDDVPYAGDYADIWVDGFHKTFPTLNQGAVLHTCNSSLICALSDAVGKFSTTSPSYPLLASIEYGAKYVSENKIQLQKVIDWIIALKKDIQDLGLIVKKTDDPLKLYVDFIESGIDVRFAGERLEKEKIFFEMQDRRGILFMFSVMSTKKDVNKLYHTMCDISKADKKTITIESAPIKLTKKLDYLEARDTDKEWVELESAVGRISAQNVGNFPPCSPIIIAGEIISKEVIDQIDLKSCFGVKDGKILVVKD